MTVNGHPVDKKTLEMYTKVAEQFNISPVEVHKMVSYTFRRTSIRMGGYEYPRILLHYLGSIKPKIGEIEQKIRYLYKSKNYPGANVEQIKYQVYQLLKTRKRLIFEHYSQKNDKNYSIYDSQKFRGVVTKYSAYNRETTRRNHFD